MNVVRPAVLVALIAGLTTAASATEASAATPIVGGGSFARTIPFIDGSIYAWECHAAAPGAVSTTISSCTLNSVDGADGAPPVTSQGPVAGTDGAVSTNPALTYHVCWTVSASYADGTSQTTSGCTLSSSIAGAG
jgi:hypothetical protein